jgi:hypothetical protein
MTVIFHSSNVIKDSGMHVPPIYRVAIRLLTSVRTDDIELTYAKTLRCQRDVVNCDITSKSHSTITFKLDHVAAAY